MKKVFFIISCLICSLTTNAQASYGDLFFVDYNVKINVSTEKDSVFLFVILTSASQKMTDTPKLLLRLMDDTIVSLDGKLLSSSSKTDGAYMAESVAMAVTHFITEAKFPISREQVECIGKGIKKLRLNTSPKFHEKAWRRDKIGKVLFAKYKESSGNSFEDDF